MRIKHIFISHNSAWKMYQAYTTFVSPDFTTKFKSTHFK